MKNLGLILCGAMAFAAGATPSFAGVDMNAVAAEAALPVAPGAAANTVELQSNADGVTVARVTLPGGFRYVIVNDICAVGGTCDRLGFIVVFNPSAGDFSFAAINQWNALRPPQAFKTTEGGTILAHYVLARGGIPAASLAQNFEFWNDSVLSFNNYLANAPKGVTVSVSAEIPSPSHSVLNSWFEHELIGNDDANGKLMLPD